MILGPVVGSVPLVLIFQFGPAFQVTALKVSRCPPDSETRFIRDSPVNLR